MSGYIGTQPVPQATQTRDSFTATSGQTSFATGGYTPNFLDIFLNGVKLSAADYTASNGSDVVLASGAATGDILEVVAFTTFTPANIPSGTPSIDDNGDATAITIDSNENVMLGNTVANPASGFASQAGFGYTGSTGVVEIATTANAAPLEIGKNNANDGQLIALRKQGTVVGSIGTQGSRLSIGSGDVNLNFNASANSMYPISNPTTGALSSGIVDLGAALATFKDAYLSGGVYLGGTGSANLLDSYEEGSYNTTLATDTSSTVPTFAGTTYYVKVGSVVHIHGQLAVSGSSSGGINLHVPLPFTPIGMRGALTVGLNQALSMKPSGEYLNIIVETSSPKAYIVSTAFGGGHSHLGFDQCGSGLFTFSGSYRTA